MKSIICKKSVFQRVNRRRNASATGNESLAGFALYGHNGCVAEKAAELHVLAYALADHGDHAHGGGFRVDNADGDLVCNNAGDRGGRGVTGDGDHIQTHRGWRSYPDPPSKPPS